MSTKRLLDLYLGTAASVVNASVIESDAVDARYEVTLAGTGFVNDPDFVKCRLRMQL